MDERVIEELLEAVWVAKESGDTTHQGLSEAMHPEESRMGNAEIAGAVAEANKRGLLTVDERRIVLTKKGLELARSVIRRHRLAERLLRDVLDIGGVEMESHACRFEHLLSPDATTSICILLGHPTTCPHGKPIPPGECCKKGVVGARPLVIPATSLDLHEDATVAYIGAGDSTRLDRLAMSGVLPGCSIRVEQKRPSYLLKVDETLLGLDDAIVREIYVRHGDKVS